MPDDLTSALDQIRERAWTAANFVLADEIEYEEYRRISASALDVPLLLAAIDAVLKLTDGPVGLEGRGFPGDGQAVRRAVRSAITSALTGTQQGEGESHA